MKFGIDNVANQKRKYIKVFGSISKMITLLSVQFIYYIKIIYIKLHYNDSKTTDRKWRKGTFMLLQYYSQNTVLNVTNEQSEITFLYCFI